MYTKKADQEVMIRSEVQKGKGDISFRHFLKEGDVAGAGRLFAVTTIQPGDSIGNHPHTGECEAYYIVKGTAKIIDNGEEYTLEAGDVMLCKDGDAHGIENIGDEPLEFIALILYTQK